jgi:ribosomal protein S30
MRILPYFLLILTALPLAAQKKSGKAPRTCRILYLRAPAGAPTKLYLFDGKSSQVVKLPRMNLSQTYRLPPGRIKIHLLPHPIDNPKKLPEQAPSVVFPPHMRDCYLLVSSDPKNPIAPVHLQLINASSDHFSKGHILWFNLSPNLVKGKVGNQNLKLPAQSRKYMKPPTNQRENYPVDLSFMVPDDKRPHPLCETSWLHDPRSRMIAFIFNEKGRRAPRILAFPDFRPPPKKDKP